MAIQTRPPNADLMIADTNAVMTTVSFRGNRPRRSPVTERFGTIDAIRAEAFEDVARLAAFICQTPVDLVAIVDSTRRWFLSRYGVRACKSSPEVSFCIHALVSPDLLIVPDARDDARFANNPAVAGRPFVRFSVGAPLVTADGNVLGTLCVVDYMARTLSPGQVAALKALSRTVTAQMDYHRLKRELTRLKYGD